METQEIIGFAFMVLLSVVGWLGANKLKGMESKMIAQDERLTQTDKRVNEHDVHLERIDTTLEHIQKQGGVLDTIASGMEELLGDKRKRNAR